jgi:hypothetical protein
MDVILFLTGGPCFESEVIALRKRTGKKVFVQPSA